MFKVTLPILFIASACAAFAQQTPRLPLPQEAAINLPAQPVGASDLLIVNIYNQPALSRTVRVSTDGFIRLPMLKERISAAKLLPVDLENAIATSYVSEGILVDPQVTVNIAEYHSHPIQVGGAVKKPLTFQAEAPISLLEAINKAEGLTDLAGPEILVSKTEIGLDGLKKSGITRRITVKSLIEGGDESANLVLTGGEEVRVPEAGRIFVVGNVKKPGTFPIKQGSEASVLQALALTEGLMPYASNTAYIYRKEANGQKNEVPIEISKIMARKSPDVALLPDDILYIPENGRKKATLGMLEKTLLIGGGAAATALAYGR